MAAAIQYPPYRIHEGKKLVVEAGGIRCYCYAVSTKLVTQDDRLADIIAQFVSPLVQHGDIVFLSEKMVACTQGRALPLTSIHPGFWARLLSRFVTKTPSGIGLGMSETMQCAIEEVGLPRILLASVAGAAAKLLGKKGWFYSVAGRAAAAIDGPCHWTIPPYNEYVVLAPLDPAGIAKEVSRQLSGLLTLVVDLNDLGGEILAASEELENPADLLAMLSQNPLGQTDECTPVGILRPL